jgi:hypothetical protein
MILKEKLSLLETSWSLTISYLACNILTAFFKPISHTDHKNCSTNYHCELTVSSTIVASWTWLFSCKCSSTGAHNIFLMFFPLNICMTYLMPSIDRSAILTEWQWTELFCFNVSIPSQSGQFHGVQKDWQPVANVALNSGNVEMQVHYW